jgi:thiol:disulfide interchange protein
LLRRLAARPLVLSAVAALTVGAGAFALHSRASRTPASACDRPDHAACAMPAPKAEEGTAQAVTIPNGPAVLEFTSEYCPACRRLEPVFEDARRQCLRAGANVVRLDVESVEGGALATSYQVAATPTLVFLDAQHQEVARLVGAKPLEDVRKVIERAYGLECAMLAPSTTRGREAGPG